MRSCRLAFALLCSSLATTAFAAEPVDFNQDIRSLLSNKCFTCHGPDSADRQGGLRLDTRDGATAEADSGERAIVPGDVNASELIARITSDDEGLRMPPADKAKQLTPREIDLMTEWIQQGAAYAEHWSYAKPIRSKLPEITGEHAEWPMNAVDHFILARLLQEGLAPSETADRYALIRRVSLDLTGLPPNLQEVEQFVNDQEPKAYERLVDRLLEKQAYGEHWARMWLDLARYADSAGYADDPPRTIWGFRDYVIRSLNQNKPFDQFTIEQIAGDLLPDPTQEQLIATAFHRNTLTNNEGGTNDEEFRNVAIVDRVNTTMAVWMGTTIDCCQCHNHKYDPLTQKEYFQLFAILNNTQDADRRDESPLVEIWTDQQQQQKKNWLAEIDKLEARLATVTPQLRSEQAEWEDQFGVEPNWRILRPTAVKVSSGKASVTDDGSVLVTESAATNVYKVELSLDELINPEQSSGSITALQLETLPHESLPGKGPGHASGNFVMTRLLASITPPKDKRVSGRYVRIENPGKQAILSLAEVQVYSGADNVAVGGEATQSSTGFSGPAELAIDGNTDGNYLKKSVTHTTASDNPWWELDLQKAQSVDRVLVWNRTDNNLHTRLANFRVALLDENRTVVWEKTIAESPNPSVELSLGGVRAIPLAAAYSNYAQSGFPASGVLDGKQPNKTGWAIGGATGQPHALTLLPRSPIEVVAGSKLTVTIEQNSQFESHTVGHFRVSATGDADVSKFAKTPGRILVILKTRSDHRSPEQNKELADFYLSIAPSLAADRDQLARLKKQVAEAKPATTVPVLRELAANARRETHVQMRGNFLVKGEEVQPGLPAAFHSAETETPDRMTLARWLIDDDNPLTARVIANRYWEAIFGIGLVRTSEEFGSQGELPSHPRLLDWLATELVRQDWDIKAFLRMLVTSATYRQSSRVTPELIERDPDNRLLARGPRVRLSAEMIRDQALSVSGLLSDKLYGPPVKPPQPSSGLRAAFGGGIDWQTSKGEDRYRRGLYTTWRRSNPYPSMAAFDAPNRQVCTIRRDRTNTPLQALVTLNDPVYIEAAQALSRRMVEQSGTTADKARYGFRLCLARPPSDAELDRLTALYDRAHSIFTKDATKAMQMATKPLGPIPEGTEATELAAWVVVGNVLLNLDEMFMKR